MFNYSSPVIIIGAPRSGTNMLRDVLTSIEGIDTWPCDEINYIWRHGNVRYPSDELPVELATPSIQKYIQGHFESIQHQTGAKTIVEKTCANSLRVPFVNKVLPEARYIFIYRDGIDAVGSAKSRWTASLDIPYVMKKARFVPKLDLPYYAIRYLWARIHRFFSKEKRLAFWGPALNNMQDILKKNSLEEVCALQWQSCVEKSEAALSSITPEKVIKVRYEDFVTNPEQELKKILDFIGEKVPQEKISRLVSDVSAESIGKGRTALGEEKVKALQSLVGDTLSRYGY